MIIDVHCHAGIGERMSGPWDSRADLGKYLARARQAQIELTVVFAPFTTDYERANRRTADLVGRSRGRLLGFACVHPEADQGRVDAMLQEAKHTLDLRGVKVHGHDAPLTREVAHAAQRLGLPVLFDPVGHPTPVELFATEFPRLPIILPHLGSFSDDWVAQRAVIDLLVRHPNVFTDTSGVRRFDLLAEAVQRAGAHKVLFGSDGPWLHPGVELAKVYALELPPADEQLVLGGNALRLLGRRDPMDGSRPVPPQRRNFR